MAILNIKLRTKEDVEQQRAQSKYLTAQAAYMEALTDLSMDEKIRDADRMLKNTQALMAQDEYKSKRKQLKMFKEDLSSEDPAVRQRARNAFMGIETSKALAEQLDVMNTQINFFKLALDAMGEQRAAAEAKANQAQGAIDLMFNAKNTFASLFGEKKAEEMMANSIGSFMGMDVAAKPGGEAGGKGLLWKTPLQGKYNLGDQTSENPELEGFLNKLNEIDIKAIGMGK